MNVVNGKGYTHARAHAPILADDPIGSAPFIVRRGDDVFGCMRICLFREKLALFVHCAHLREAECLSVLPLVEAFYAHFSVMRTLISLARYDLHGSRRMCVAAFNASCVLLTPIDRLSI